VCFKEFITLVTVHVVHMNIDYRSPQGERFRGRWDLPAHGTPHPHHTRVQPIHVQQEQYYPEVKATHAHENRSGNSCISNNTKPLTLGILQILC